MKNILVISNCAVSSSESNGRIHTNFIKDYLSNNTYNFYIRGNPDIKTVNYITISNKNALLTKLSLGLIKPRLVSPIINEETSTYINKSNSKSKYAFFHLLRSFCFIHNNKVINELNKYIKKNKIDLIMLWGCNVPYLYNYAYKLARSNNIDLVTFTGEDYPIKNYNYLSDKISIFYPCLRSSLYKECRKVYLTSKKNIYACKELKEVYEKEFNISNGEVVYFSSSLEAVNRVEKDVISNIVYGGNLYIDRVRSLLELASYLERFNNIHIDVYGKASEQVEILLSRASNITYHKEIPYIELLDKLKKADILLHVEGFSKEYINDCRYAFSTKIADYYSLGIPFILYGPIDISGIAYARNINKDYVIIDKDELSKLDKIISKEIEYKIDNNKIKEELSSSSSSNKVRNIIENC